ncbi:MAG TPA: hypothetical protein VEK08_11800 [Planctomycetota bacterium]|nr:hypothetical protein [Planctomycetota bacterium]
MSPELKKEKVARFVLAWSKLDELQQAEPAGDPAAQERAAANHVTSTLGISRPLADRYIAQANIIRKTVLQGAPKPEDVEKLITDELIERVSNLDEKFGMSFMVLPHHVDQILKGGKHMSRRFRRWGDPGDTFLVKGKKFRFTRVDRLRVGDITDEDIKKEGYATREEFDQMWIKSHPKSVAAGKVLKPDDLCWCHEYEPA